jgi:hypothetical protein
MKQKIAIAGIIILTLGIFSCTNQDWNFPDFDYTTTYFPYQYPVRTLVLGDYYFDNTNDNLHKFQISASSGGGYNNKENITVSFVVDPTLTNGLYLSPGVQQMVALPTNYYTLRNTSEITIPRGQPNGSVEVQLTDSFFDDPLAIGVNYVIPLRITESTTDSVLQGKPAISDPDPRIAGNWVIVPKNFTLFCVRFVNEYHGNYLLRGTDIISNGVINIDTIVYRNKYVEKCDVVSVVTSARSSVSYSNTIRLSPTSPGKFEMNMAFDADGNATLTNTAKYPSATITGTGKFSKGTEEWGDIARDAIYLDYKIVEGTRTHTIKDTLVFRDKGVKKEEFVPVIK